jgi:hypothetical protein
VTTWLHDYVRNFGADCPQRDIAPLGRHYFKDVDDGWISLTPHSYGNSGVKPSAVCVRAGEEGPTEEQIRRFVEIEERFPSLWDAAYEALHNYRVELQCPLSGVETVRSCILCIDPAEGAERRWALEIKFSDEEVAFIAYFDGSELVDVEGAF